jgi:hypothetical protein
VRTLRTTRRPPDRDRLNSPFGCPVRPPFECAPPVGRTNADAAGLAIFPWLARYKEVTAGEVDHAIRITMSQTQRGCIATAMQRDGVIVADNGSNWFFRASHHQGWDDDTGAIIS